MVDSSGEPNMSSGGWWVTSCNRKLTIVGSGGPAIQAGQGGGCSWTN